MSGAGAVPAWSESAQAAGAASLADVLPPLRYVLPEELIDRRGWERLAARTGRLPPSAADAMFGFECRLDDPEASADLLLSVPSDSRFAGALVREGSDSGLRAASLARFLAEARRPGSPFAAAVDLVALEYDIVGVEGSPAPGVFLRSAAASGHTDPGLLTASVALAVGWREKLIERNGAARILAALPPGAAVRWVGAFPDREKRAVRLLVRALGDDSTTFLSRIGWPGDKSAIDRIVSAFRACGVDNHVLALDMAEGTLSPGLGLELSRPGHGGGSWREALDMMVRERWCLPDKAAAFGLTTRSERLFSRAGISELHCGIHHVKLALPARGHRGLDSHDDVKEAKGYVACVLRPLP